jgi:hypothetical protein
VITGWVRVNPLEMNQLHITGYAEPFHFHPTSVSDDLNGSSTPGLYFSTTL